MKISRPEDVGLLVRDYRRGKGLSQNELASRAGVSRRWLANLETGKSTVEIGLVLKTLEALGLVLDVSPPRSRAVDLDRLIYGREIDHG